MKSKNVSNWQKRALKREKKPERLFKIVDKVLKQIFGEPATLFIYKHLEEKHSLKREDIANELEIFTEGLEKYLGDSGTFVVLETLFNESSELKLRKVEEREFLEQLKELKRISYR
jgi:hypothetical protein